MADLLHSVPIDANPKAVYDAVATDKGMQGWRAGTTLEWSVRPSGDGTLLDFRHGNWKSMTPYAAMCNSTWGELMYRLKSFVETGRPNPRWSK